MRTIVVPVMVTSLIIGLLVLTSSNQSADGTLEVQLLLETDKPVYKLGEDIFIALTNVGSQSIEWVGLWPPFDVYAHPSGELVCRAMECFCIFTLAAGENMTHNLSEWFLFGGVIAECGTYVAVDNQGWGLSAYFTIVDAEIIVPDDYLTIQEAINAANDEDTIFVRSGTYDEYLNVTKSLVILGENLHNTTATGFEIHADNVTVSGFTMKAWSYSGVSLYDSCYCSIINNVVISDFYAIVLMNSSGNYLANNRIPYSVNGVGISLLIGCNDNTVRQNSISQQEVGIHILDSHNNTLDCNELFSNYFAIYAYGGLNCIYHNNVVNNRGGAMDAGGNAWDNGCEGNFWSNYNGSDLNGDGIGDTNLPWEGVDNYPLMNLYWSPGDIDHDLDVDIFDVVKCGIAYGSTPSDPNWNPHCDIAEPYGIINIFDIGTIAASYGEEFTP